MNRKRTLSLALLMSASLYASGTETTQLSPVVITPAKTAEPLTLVTSDISVITSDDIKERGFTTVDQLLATLPGIQVQSNGGPGQSASVRIRGFDTNRVLVLIDGIRYNDPTLIGGAANFAHLLTDDIARIEIIRGPQSGVWGADASAGVINIITKKAEKEGFSATLFGEYGSFNTKKYGLNTAYKKGPFDASLDIVRFDSDGFSAIAPDEENLDDYEDDAYKNSTVNLRLGYRITDNDKVSGTLNYIDATTDYDGYDANFKPDPDDSNSSVDTKEQLARIDYTHTFEKGSLSLYGAQSRFKRELATGFTKLYKGRVDEAGINGRYDYTGEGFLVAGLDQKRFKDEAVIDNSYKNQGFFLTNNNSFNGMIDGTTIMTESLRYDKFDAFDNRMTWKVGLKHIHEKIRGLWTAFNYATGYNVPTLYQLYSPYGNPGLNPEKTKGFDITANYKGAQVTYFDNSIDDMIDFGPDYKYANISGKSSFKGVELSYSGSYAPLSLSYGANYTWLKAEDKDGKDLPRRAKNSANVTLDYYGIPDAHIGLLAKYVGKRKKSPYDIDPTRDDSAYTVVDFNGDYRVTKRFSLYARVENLLDKTYQDISGYATSPRAFYAGFRYRVR